MNEAIRRLTLCACLVFPAAIATADEKRDDQLTLMDVFELEYASDPRIAPDGESVVYVRNFMDIMSDTRRSNLWTIRFDGSEWSTGPCFRVSFFKQPPTRGTCSCIKPSDD